MSPAAAVGQSISVEELERDPYPAYARLREEEPVSWVESVGLWLVTRWDDVQHVVKTREVFTAETEPSTLNRTFGKNLLGSEGPYHDRVRAIISPWFRMRAIGHFPADVIAPIANELVDGFAARGEVELASEFAEPLSVRVLRRAMGLEGIDDDTLRRWFQELALGAANFEGDPEKQAVADAASADVNETIAPILERLRDEPNDTLLSSMLHERVDGEGLTLAEIQANLKVMIVGGLQAVGDLISISMWALLAHPEQADRVRADASLVDPAVEEAARWYSPVGTSTRQTTRETELAGTALPAGALIAAVLSSANRDSRHWEDPDRFDLDTHRRPHLAFAGGAHVCVGALLGRFEARTAMHVLLERLPRLRLDPDRPAGFEGWEFRSPTHLHLLFDPPPERYRMATTTEELTPDYMERLARVQPDPAALPEDLDLFYEDTARRGIRLNKAGHSLKHQEQRELFARDEEAWMDQFGLTDEERALVRGRDWIGLWRAGMSIYVMTKLSGVTKTPLVEIGKQMRESG
ncbi:MAG TPA: cytochrome P450 [Thermoleophilaceae bacterium]|jgi:cytochrome P450